MTHPNPTHLQHLLQDWREAEVADHYTDGAQPPNWRETGRRANEAMRAYLGYKHAGVTPEPVALSECEGVTGFRPGVRVGWPDPVKG